MQEMSSSSPDPLGLSDQRYNASPHKPERPAISPRKPLASTSGNAVTQDFYMTTPPANKKPSSHSKASSDKNREASPWRIRLTVQAERFGEENIIVSEGNMQHGTTTTTVPLKFGDDGTPAVKRGRGRPKKSLDSKMGNGTPRPKAGLGDRSAHGLDTSSIMDTWAPTPPRRVRNTGWRRRKADGDSSLPDQSLPTAISASPGRQTPERTMKARPFSRSRSRSRRKEITPRKLGQLTDLENEECQLPTPTGQAKPEGTQNVVLSRHELKDTDRHSSIDISALAVPDHPASSYERSTDDIEDERMWRSMIRKDSVSPPLDLAAFESPGHPVDPPGQQHEFDTILESEGFSMVSVESLRSSDRRSIEQGPARLSPPSTEREDSIEASAEYPGSERSMSAITDESTSPLNAMKPDVLINNTAKRVITPSMGLATPPQPSAPDRSLITGTERVIDELSDGTPKHERAARASAVLQSVPSPDSQATFQGKQRLASPFIADKYNLGNEHFDTSRHPVLLDSTGANQPDADLVGGFSAAERRELRAGLRLGEELAKRQRTSLNSPDDGSKVSQHLCLQQNSPLYPQIQLSQYYSSALYDEPGENEASSCPPLPNPQLPSPAESDIEDSKNKMSWQAELQQSASPHQLTSADEVSQVHKSMVDYTMLAREAEWQRERQAVSRQIRNASSSQVIVIDDDTLDPESTPSSYESNHDSQVPSTQDADITGELKDASQTTPGRATKADVTNFRRSKLPSPWLRHTGNEVSAEQSRAQLTESDLFWQPDLASIDAANKRKQRKKVKEASPGSSQLTSPISREGKQTTGRNQVSLSSRTLVDPAIELFGNTSLDTFEPTMSEKVRSHSHCDLDSHEANKENFQATKEVLAEEEHCADSYEANKHNLQPTEELIAVDEPHWNSYEANKDNLQPTEDLLAENNDTVTLAEDVPPAVVPLPGSPALEAIDPDLLEPSEAPATYKPLSPPKALATKKPQPRPSTTLSSSWFSALAAPLASLFISAGPSCPPATKEDILLSSPYEPLPWYLPFTSAHLRAIEPLVWSSLLYNPGIFPYNPNSVCRYMLGAKVSTGRGWGREFTKQDCGVIDAFRVLLRYRGVAPEEGQGLCEGERLSCQHIAVGIVRVWVHMVMNGYVDFREWKGAKTGMRKEGDRWWRENDVVIDETEKVYVDMRRRKFVDEGLPSWKARGWGGPFRLAKPL